MFCGFFTIGLVHWQAKIDGNIGWVKETKDAEKVELVEHIDGDTSKFKINGKVERVRYLLIDTAETKHPKLGEQPLGKEASAFVKEMLEIAKEIKLAQNKDQCPVDDRFKHGRTLRFHPDPFTKTPPRIGGGAVCSLIIWRRRF